MEAVRDSWERLLAGGWYMLPLVLVGAVMFSCILSRGFSLFIAFRQLANAAQKTKEVPAQGWLYALHMEYLRSRTGVADIDATMRELLGKRFVAVLRAEGGFVLLCASVATLLGLLGTVSGMIASFTSMQALGVANTKALSSGVSEALVTTQSGLLIGVFGVAAGTFLQRMNDLLYSRLLIYCREYDSEAFGTHKGKSYDT